MNLPVVALHGFTGTGRSFESLGLSHATFPLLSGHGPNPDLSSHSFEEEVERIFRITRKGGTKVHLIGYSMGARLALGLALARPDLVERLTLIGVNPGLEDEAEREARLAWESRWIDILDVDGIAVFEHRWRALPIFDSQASMPPAALEEQVQQCLSHTARGLSHAMQVLGLGSMPNFWPRLSELPGSTQVVVGEKDSKFQEIAAKMAQQAPQLRVVQLAGSGHNPLLEAPAELKAVLDSSEFTL